MIAERKTRYAHTSKPEQDPFVSSGGNHQRSQSSSGHLERFSGTAMVEGISVTIALQRDAPARGAKRGLSTVAVRSERFKSSLQAQSARQTKQDRLLDEPAKAGSFYFYSRGFAFFTETIIPTPRNARAPIATHTTGAPRRCAPIASATIRITQPRNDRLNQFIKAPPNADLKSNGGAIDETGRGMRVAGSLRGEQEGQEGQRLAASDPSARSTASRHT